MSSPLEEAYNAFVKRTTSPEVKRGGNSIVVPANMSERDAANFLNQRALLQEQQEQDVSVSRVYQYRPWDMAAAVRDIIEAHYGGVVQVKSPPPDPFSPPSPPQLISISTGVGTTTQVPWGRLSLVSFPGTVLALDAARDPELGPLGAIDVTCPRKYAANVENLFDLIEAQLRSHSIYRGRAFDGKDMPEFLDLSTVDADKVVFNDDIRTHLEANIWSPLKHTDRLAHFGLSLKRAVLLEGPYGTGKTLAAYLTAKVAVENGWTFIYCRAGRDDLQHVIGTARLYQPSCVLFEDIDTVAGVGAKEEVSRLLDTLDGINAKGTRMMSIFTTNHANKIHKGMVRPGRLDAVISIGPLNADKIRYLVEVTIPSTVLSAGVEWDKITDAFDGFMPAFVKEGIERTLRYAIARGDGSETIVTTDDFVLAAQSLRPQLRLMDDAPEEHLRPSLEAGIGTVLKDTLKGGRFVYSNKADDYVFVPNAD